jgi:hypothetical protein
VYLKKGGKHSKATIGTILANLTGVQNTPVNKYLIEKQNPHSDKYMKIKAIAYSIKYPCSQFS